MTLSPEKTRVAHIDEGFDFLGWNFRKYHGKLLIKPSEKNVKTFLTKVRDWVGSHKQARQIDVIGFLNPLIRGWANYHHRGAVAKETFAHVDAKIFELLWQWAKRRHPEKSPHGSENVIFALSGPESGCLRTETKKNSGYRWSKPATRRSSDTSRSGKRPTPTIPSERGISRTAASGSWRRPERKDGAG